MRMEEVVVYVSLGVKAQVKVVLGGAEFSRCRAKWGRLDPALS